MAFNNTPSLAHQRTIPNPATTHKDTIHPPSHSPHPIPVSAMTDYTPSPWHGENIQWLTWHQ
jgi:hypothetical protein